MYRPRLCASIESPWNIVQNNPEQMLCVAMQQLDMWDWRQSYEDLKYRTTGTVYLRRVLLLLQGNSNGSHVFELIFEVSNFLCFKFALP